VALLPRDEECARSLELPRLLGLLSAKCPEFSVLILFDDLDAFRFAKNDREGSRLCFEVSLDCNGYCGIAVKPGVGGPLFSLPINGFAVLGGTRTPSVVECRVTGRIVAPLGKGELGDDFADRGVNGLNDAALKESFFLELLSKFEEIRSRFGRVDCREGILHRLQLY
jgi:hypothetical protein